MDSPVFRSLSILGNRQYEVEYGCSQQGIAKERMCVSENVKHNVDIIRPSCSWWRYGVQLCYKCASALAAVHEVTEENFGGMFSTLCRTTP